MADVFISYSRKNSVFARRLIDRLILDSKDAWVDWEGIPLTSPNWWGEIKAGIEGADNFVFIISPDSTASVVCNMELDYAIELKKRIVPVVYQDVQTRDAFASIADYIPDEAMTERLAGKDPLIIARENWRRLSDINWVFLRESDDFDTAYERLITTVETDLEYVKAHTRYLVRATEWQRESQREDLLLFGGEIDRAEAWLQKAEGYTARAQTDAANKVSNPLPKDLHHTYIRTSREQDTHRRRELRNLRIGRLSFAAVGALAAIIALASLVSLNDTQRRAAIASTQVAFAEATVTQAAIIEKISSDFSYTLLNQSGNPSQQIAAMNALVQRYPDEALAYLSRGIVYAEQRDFVKAIEDYTEAIGIHSNYAEAYNNRGNARRDSGDLESAIEDYNEAIRLHPNYAEAYTNRGNARSVSGDLEGAIADYTEAIQLSPDLATTYFNRGSVRHDSGDLEGAIADYTEAIRIDPNYAEAYSNRGKVRIDSGELESAIEDFSQAIHIAPNLAAAYNNRGGVLSNLGDLEGAIKDFSQAIYIDPNYAEAHNNRGSARGDGGDFVGAIEDYNEAIQLNPNFSQAYYNRGNLQLEMGDLMGAIADYTEAIRLNPNFSQAYYNRGGTRYYQGDLEGAIADYTKVIRLNPDYSGAYYNRGLARRDSGDFEDAIADYSEAIRLDPNDALAYYDRAIAHYYLAQGQFESEARIAELEQALADWRQAESLEYTLPDAALDGIAQIEAELGGTSTPAP